MHTSLFSAIPRITTKGNKNSSPGSRAVLVLCTISSQICRNDFEKVSLAEKIVWNEGELIKRLEPWWQLSNHQLSWHLPRSSVVWSQRLKWYDLQMWPWFSCRYKCTKSIFVILQCTNHPLRDKCFNVVITVAMAYSCQQNWGTVIHVVKNSFWFRIMPNHIRFPQTIATL